MPFTKGPDGRLIPHTAGSSSKAGSKRRATDALGPQSRRPRYLKPATIGDRESSPDKRVSFGRRLERGPSPAYSRQRTPSRSALARPPVETTEAVDLSEDSEASYDPDPSDEDGPSHQLWSESTYAAQRESPQSGHKKRTSNLFLRFTPVTSDFQELNPLPTEQQLKLKDIADEAQRDNEVCRRVHKLRARIVDFAQRFVDNRNISFRKERCLEDLCEHVQSAQLVRYIGCLAQGGPKGEESWRELLANPECRVALLVGIIGTALKEHVFSELWFGGTDEQIDELERLQEKQKHGEGYERTKQRAKACSRYADENDLPAARKVAIALQKMLATFYSLGQERFKAIPGNLLEALFKIVTVAGNLSREMRRCSDVIYHWPPTFKDEEFDPERMECINISDMISTSPFEKKLIDGHERSVLKEPTEDSEAIVKIVAFPGLVVHRQGGGALAKRLLEEEADDYQYTNAPPDVQRARRMAVGEKLTGNEGFRTRVICKSVVHLVWGRQRLLTREAGTSAHIDAMRDGKEKKYEDDRKGFVELYDYFLEHNEHARSLL